jgi:hypothetical protein
VENNERFDFGVMKKEKRKKQSLNWRWTAILSAFGILVAGQSPSLPFAAS